MTQIINPLTISLAASLGSALLRRQPEFQGLDPAMFQDQLTLSDQDLAGIRQGAINRASRANIANVANIKQAGAAGRLPKGAVLSAISGSSQKLAEGVAGIEPGLQDVKRRSLLDFLNLKGDFDRRKMAFESGQADKSNLFTQDTLGGLGKILILQRAGFFDKPKGP